MQSKLLIQTITKFLIGLVVVSMLLFLPAGTIHYWNAWLFMGVLFIPMFIAGLILLLKSPSVLAKRLNAKEEEAVLREALIGYAEYTKKVKYRLIPFIW